MTTFPIYFLLIVVFLIIYWLYDSKETKELFVSRRVREASIRVLEARRDHNCIKVAQLILEENRLTDYGSYNKEKLEIELRESILQAKIALHGNMPDAVFNAYRERTKLIILHLSISLDEVETEISEFMSGSPEARKAYFFYEEFKKAVRKRDGFWVGHKLDDMRRHYRKYNILLPDNFNNEILRAWQDAIGRSLSQAKKVADKKDEFWTNTYLGYAKEYAVRKKGNLDIKKEIREIKGILMGENESKFGKSLTHKKIILIILFLVSFVVLGVTIPHVRVFGASIFKYILAISASILMGATGIWIRVICKSQK